MNKEIIPQRIQEIIPELDNSKYKGKCGKIAVIGGSLEYTGAPYFAAITALRTGCDLAHIFCHKDAAIAIKSYSPETIVHPLFDENTNIAMVLHWLETVHAVVIGPGLGRNPKVIQSTIEIIKQAIEKNIIMIFDADGLFILNSNLDLIKGRKNVVLTPNQAEYKRLCTALNVNQTVSCKEIAQLLGGVTIVQKGQFDVISNGNVTVECHQIGSTRRCGGQGDLLSGSLTTFMSWVNQRETKEERENDMICGCLAACCLVKECSKKAFEINHRGMVAGDMIQFVPEMFYQLFDMKQIELQFELL